MAALYAFAFLVCFYAFGDIIATKTKGLLSSIFVICVVMLIGFWLGLPKDIAAQAGISGLGSALVAPLVVGIGTTMNFTELKRQWKTAVVSFVGTAVGVVAIIFLGSILIGRNEALASAPIFAGASVALMVINQALTDKGLIDSIGVVVITIFATQKFIGVPLCSFCLQKEAYRFLNNKEQMQMYLNAEADAKSNGRERIRPLSFACKINKPGINLAKLTLIGCLSYFLGSLTGGKIHHLVISLIMGVIFTELGFLEKSSLSKTDSNFLMTFLTIMTVFSSLANVTPQSLLNNLLPVLIVLVIGSLGVIVSGFVCGKIFKMSPMLCIALAITCTFGFPTNVQISNEIAELGSTNDEKKALTNYILPKMTVAGFITVTIGSVILAGIVAPFIG